MEDLEIMREQLAAVKRRLDTQQIVNNKLMRKIMRHKAAWLNKFVAGEIIAMPLTFILFAIICVIYGTSLWYAVSFLILGGIDTALDWRTVRIPAHMFSNASILDLKKFLLKQKKERFVQTCFMLPLCILWLVMFFSSLVGNTDLSVSDDLHELVKIGGMIGGLVGAVIGAIAVIIIYRKIQSTGDNLMDDIIELEKEQD